MARASRFVLRLGSVIPQLAFVQARVTADWLVAFRLLATEKDSRRVAAAVSFVARSSPGFGRFVFGPFALCPLRTRFVTGDLESAAADPVSLAGPDLVAAAAAVVVVAAVALAAVLDSAVVAAGVDSVAVAAGSAVDSVEAVFAAAVDPDFAYSAGSVCSFEATGKGRAVVAISCFLTPRSFF